MNQRYVKKGEALALRAESIRSGNGAMWFDIDSSVPQNERIGSVAVVRIHGGLDHHDGYGCDSYAAIKSRVADALSGEDAVRENKARAIIATIYGDKPIQVEEVVPPSAVVLRIDTPGGVVSGLNECVFALRRMSEEAGIPLIAYVDELAASAGYALACACSEIFIPASGIAGSIGVISSLFEQTKADEAMGLRFVTLTSGAHKADGHPHVELSASAIAAEQDRVDTLAMQFYELVSDARKIKPNAIKSYEANIFIGEEAVSKRLADMVMSWDELVAVLNKSSEVKQNKLAKLNQSNPHSFREATYQLVGRPEETQPMNVALEATLRRAEIALEKATDPEAKKDLAALVASSTAHIAAYKKTKHMIEKTETEEGDDPPADEDKEKATAAEAPCDDDKDDDDEEAKDAKKTAKAVLAGGSEGRRALGRLTSTIDKARKYDALNERVAAIEARAFKAEKTALIDEAVAQRRIPRHLAKMLHGKDLDFVKGTLEMHKSPMVNIDEEALATPDGTPNGDLPDSVKKSIEEAVSTRPDLSLEDQEKFRQSLYTAQRERMAKSSAAGRY